MILAHRGRHFSFLESYLELYCQTHARVEKIKRGEKLPDDIALEQYGGATPEQIAEFHTHLTDLLRSLSTTLTQIFIKAIVERDHNKIIEIATAVAMLKRGTPDKDPVRERILQNKITLENIGVQFDIDQWAGVMNWPQDDRDNGCPRLRTLLKELGVVIKRKNK